MTNQKSYLKSYSLAKILVVSITVSIFLLYIERSSASIGTCFSNDFLLFALLGTSLALHFMTFQTPPSGQVQSMDSSIYLACIFVYNDAVSITMVMLNCILGMAYDRSKLWWKQLIHMGMYAIVIKAAALAFSLSGGVQGEEINQQLLSYVIALLVYMIGNTLFVFLYNLLIHNASFSSLFSLLLRESLLIYGCTMLLSLVLAALLIHNSLVGLLLFAGIAIMLSYYFRRLFHLYGHLQNPSTTDLQTGLNNHSRFEELLNCHFQNARYAGVPLALALLDIDHFKHYNEHFGHRKGDQLIQKAAIFLKKECEAMDSITLILSRYGGDEFALLMPHYDLERANRAVNILRKKMNDTYFEGVEILPLGCLSVSAGIAVYSPDLIDKSQLVDNAFQALACAKHQGKNTTTSYGSQQLYPLLEEFDITQEIRDIEQQLSLFLYKDIHTFQHSKRVFRYAMDISNILGLDKNLKRQFVLGALLHDIGKLEVPRELLNKQEKLTKEEWEIMKQHVSWGKKIVLSNDLYKELAPFIELHHERFDGKGYPHGLKGSEIPRLCRMLSIIDSFDAMTSERPYQRTRSIQEGLLELSVCAGSQFDPELTEVFIQYMEGCYSDQLKPSSLDSPQLRGEPDKKRYPSVIPARG